jgi:hypothetical protein
MTSEPDTPDATDSEEQLSPEEAFAEMVRLSEELGLYDGPQMRVCLTHRHINVCRRGEREGGCAWSHEPADIAAVSDWSAQ